MGAAPVSKMCANVFHNEDGILAMVVTPWQCALTWHIDKDRHLQAPHSPQEDQRQREEGGEEGCGAGQGVLTWIESGNNEI